MFGAFIVGYVASAAAFFYGVTRMARPSVHPEEPATHPLQHTETVYLHEERTTAPEVTIEKKAA